MVNKDRYRKRTDEWRKYNREHYHNFMKKLRDEFDNKCFICSHEYQKNHLIFHEINWLRHSTKLSFLAENINRFILVCKPCHHGIHWLHDNFNYEIEDILYLMKTPRPVS